MKTSIAAALVGMGAALALAGACSGGASPIGASCQAAQDCASGFCTSGTCTLADGGTGSPDGGGGTLPDGGDGGSNPDGGRGTLPDGGTCTNLECQQVSCPDGGTTSVSGHVYDPSGQVPLYNAVVYVPNGQTTAFPEGVTCDTCGAFTSGSPLVITLTKADGSFKLDNVPVGSNIPLVYQIGKWRRQVSVASVQACQDTGLTNIDDQRMPRNKTEGDIPQMAIATGSADPFECLLLKIGIDPAEFTPPGAGGRVAMFRANGLALKDGGSSAASALWTDAGTLHNYDVVLLPCEGSEKKKSLSAVENLVDYTSSGGRVFATHYSYTWFADAGDPFPSTADWEPDPKQNHDPPSPFALTVNTGFPKGQAFNDWLGNVNALDGGYLEVFETRDDVWAVNTDGGSTAWLTGYNANAASVNPNDPNTVQHLTFNMPYDPPPLADGGPGVQCGRVVFSDFHVTTNAVGDAGAGFPNACVPGPLTPQEKALVFMLFDVSSCVQSDTTAPTVCSGDGTSCGADGDCCSGLLCLDAAGVDCANDEPGAACTCQVPFN